MVSLEPWQADAVAWMRAHEATHSPPGGILAYDVGRGKTYAAVGLMLSPSQPPAQPPAQPQQQGTLVLVPKACLWDWVGVLRGAGVSPRVVAARHHAPSPACTPGASVVVATYPALLAEYSAPLRARPWGRVVMDEAHVLRNPRTRLHRACRGLTAGAKWLLTATPIQNSPGELLALARVVGLDSTDVDTVRECYLLQGGTPACPKILPAPKILPVWGGVPTVRLEVLDLRHAYETALCGALERAAEASPPGSLRFEARLRCLQACTHPDLYHGAMLRRKGHRDLGGGSRGLGPRSEGSRGLGPRSEGSRGLEEQKRSHRDHAAALRAGHPGTKLERLVEILAAAGAAGSKCLVFCSWVSEMALVQRHLFRAGLPEAVEYHGRLDIEQRAEALDNFRAARAGAVLLLQAQTGACGLNLQCADVVVLMRPSWNPAVDLQAIGRAARAGQASARVTVWRLVVRGTADQACLRAQEGKLEGITRALRNPSMQRRLGGRGDTSLSDREQILSDREQSLSEG
jgi:superfamily II DNA or RNA helicase